MNSLRQSTRQLRRGAVARAQGLRVNETIGIVRRSRPRTLLAADQRTTRSIRAVLTFLRGDDRGATHWAEAAIAQSPDNRLALGVLSRASRRTGAVTRELDAVSHLRTLGDMPALEQRERILWGKLRDSDPDWMPDLGHPEPLEPETRERVMHLHKAALPDRQTGYTVRSGYVVKSQRSAGLDPFIVTAPGFPDGGTELEGPLDLAGTRQWRLPASSAVHPGFDEELSWTTARAADVLRRERPALLHVASGLRGYDLAVPAIALGRHFNLPVVYEVRGFFEELWASGHEIAEDAELTERRYARERQVMLAADAVVTIADGMRDELVGFGIPESHITIIPNAIDETQFSPRDADPELRARYGLGDRTVIGYVSTLDSKREAIDVLLRATAELVRAGLPVACLVVGEGKRRPDYELLARELRLGDAAVFTGSVPHEDVAAYYALIDIFVIPRRNDRAAVFTTPLKPFEAMAMARPLLVSDLPALVDTAGHGERGLAFTADDPSALAAAARTLIERPELRRQLGEAGREWVVRERTWSANGRRYRELFDQILGARSVRTPVEVS
jgi:glycosyltransferase involved in cell wall biosynthesis